jgi:ABC-2 type transport system ATP-binding protein
VKEPTTTFTYTAEHRTYITSVSVLVSLFLLEGSLLILLLFLFIHNSLLKFVIPGIVAALYLLLIAVLLAPMWTRHRLSATHLHLHYGLGLNIKIPRAAIISAQPAHEKLAIFEPLRARFDAKKARLAIPFSEQGQVSLHLDKPHAYKVGRSIVMVESVLFNVDAREEFLTALDIPGGINVRRGRGGVGKGGDPCGTLSGGQVCPSTAALSEPVLPKTQPIRDFRGIPPEKQIYPQLQSNNTSSPIPAIRTEGLTRKFGSLIAVDHLDMTIHQGEIYGFLGSNGAGKTTIMKMLVGLAQPTAGHAVIVGHNVWTDPLATKAALGYVPDRSVLYERLTGREFLHFLAQMRGISQPSAEERITNLLNMLELDEHADRLCGAYSFGMKRKLSLASALLHQPQVLILDEPLNGLDPRSARRLKDLFIELASGGTTILLSTHDLATAEAVCHRIGIIHRGRLLAEGNASELRQLASASDLESVFLNLTEEQQEEVQI